MDKDEKILFDEENLYFIDNPCEEKNDAIGYSTYVNLLQNVLITDAKIIGIISSYGSGKSTIIKMLEDREKLKKDNDIKICKINLWNSPSQINRKNSNDITIDIHKSFLNQLINGLDFDIYKKKSLQKQINKNYGFLDIVVENKDFNVALYVLLALIFFIVILRIDPFNLAPPRIAIFILEMAVAINMIYLLTKSKIFFSFNKETKNNREIDEFETTDCFIKIIEACKNKQIKKLIICVEDVDRFTNGTDTIRFLEQIYKFYNESIQINEIDVKFIITIKPSVDFKDEQKIHNDKIKNIYEKIFDFIINLQPVSIQNYDALISELLRPKKNLLSYIGLNIDMDSDSYYWTYLYRGNLVTIRDIKHRYNYAINLYNNLLQHEAKAQNTTINIETCFYVAYLEDEFPNSFYNLIRNSHDFENMVIDYLMNKKIHLCSSCNLADDCCEKENIKDCKYNEEKDFLKEIKYGFENNLIDSTYSMYFFKFPRGKKIKNVYDQGINNILLRNDIQEINNFTEYANNCNKDEIVSTINKLVKLNHMPNVILKNKRLFEITYEIHIKELEKLILSYDIIKESKKTFQMLEDIKNIGGEKSIHCLDIFISNNISKIKDNLETQQIIEIREKILALVKEYPGIYFNLYNDDFPPITFEEMKTINDINKILRIIKPQNITAELLDNLKKLPKESLVSTEYLAFINDIISTNPEQLKNVIYIFDPSVFNMPKNDKYVLSNNMTLIKVLNLLVPSEILKFCQFYKFMPRNLEEIFTTNVMNLEQQEKDDLVKKYVSLIKEVNHISAVGLKFLEGFHIKYGYTNEIENEMFKKCKYNLYVYSKAIRTSLFDLDQSDRMTKLNDAYISYFVNSVNLGKNVKPTLNVLKYLSQIMDINSLIVEKRILFNMIPQSYCDVEYIIKNKDINYSNKYLKNIIEFNSSDKIKIFNLIYDWAFNEMVMFEDTYYLLKNKIDKEKRTKFGVLKSQKKLVKAQ